MTLHKTLSWVPATRPKYSYYLDSWMNAGKICISDACCSPQVRWHPGEQKFFLSASEDGLISVFSTRDGLDEDDGFEVSIRMYFQSWHQLCFQWMRSQMTSDLWISWYSLQLTIWPWTYLCAQPGRSYAMDFCHWNSSSLLQTDLISAFHFQRLRSSKKVYGEQCIRHVPFPCAGCAQFDGLCLKNRFLWREQTSPLVYNVHWELLHLGLACCLSRGWRRYTIQELSQSVTYMQGQRSHSNYCAWIRAVWMSISLT